MPTLAFPPEPTPRDTYLASVMLFPHDDAQRASFLEAIMAAGWADALKKPDLAHIIFDAKAAARLAESPRLDRDARARFRKAMENGRIVGFMLHFILNCSLVDDAKKYASVAAACRVVSKIKAGERGFDPKTVKRFIWDVYEPAAHFWAAAWAWRVEMGQGDLIMGVPIRDFDSFLCLAEEFRRRGEEWSHARGPRVLDPMLTWKTPPNMALPSLCYAFKPVSPDLISAASV